MQDTLKSTLEASVIPAFEMSCKTMFEQVDFAFQKGLAEHIAASQQQFESMHLPLSLALRVWTLVMMILLQLFLLSGTFRLSISIYMLSLLISPSYILLWN